MYNCTIQSILFENRDCRDLGLSTILHQPIEHCRIKN